jgi:hypothetical protein
MFQSNSGLAIALPTVTDFVNRSARQHQSLDARQIDIQEKMHKREANFHLKRGEMQKYVASLLNAFVNTTTGTESLVLTRSPLPKGPRRAAQSRVHAERPPPRLSRLPLDALLLAAAASLLPLSRCYCQREKNVFGAV